MRANLFATAKETLQQRRQASQAAAAHRREKIYAQLPQLAQLDEKHAQAAMQAAALAMDGRAEDAEKKRELMRDIAQRKQKLLQQNSYNAEELSPRPYCAACGDTGYVKGAPCACLQEELKRLRRDAIHDQGPLRLCSFDTFSVEYYPEQCDDTMVPPRETMCNILRDCKDYARDFGPRSRNLFLFGDAGLGKTHLALSIASVVLEKGYDVIYVSAQTAFSAVGAARYGDDNGLFSSMLGADLLVLDDLGTEYIDAYILSKLYELVNTRLGRRPTIYTSNICTQDLLHHRYTEKVASRLLGECHLMRLWGNDIRLMK